MALPACVQDTAAATRTVLAPGAIVTRRRHGDAPADGDERLNRIADIAERSRVSVRQAWRWIAAGELAVHRVGRIVRVAEAEYRRFLARMPAAADVSRDAPHAMDGTPVFPGFPKSFSSTRENASKQLMSDYMMSLSRLSP